MKIKRNYGSIPHLSTSKLTQQADKKITLGQEEILTKKARDWRDLIIVTEKLDGSNVGVINNNGEITAITRAGYTALSSPYKQHHYFDKWVKDNLYMFSFLPVGWRICGEWMIMAHGTKYNIIGWSPFVAFDIITDKEERLPFLEFLIACYKNYISSVPLLHIGQPISIKNAIELMGNGHYGNNNGDPEQEKPEGVVYRVERNGKVDFLAKWVRSDKEDGKYMEQEIYNAGSEKWRCK